MDSTLQSFLKEVKTIEKKDSVYTSEQQISRLLRPGSTYANLNPFGVLLVDPDEPYERIRKQYKKLSILLHPDKNPNDRERAQSAFDALNKAYKMLEDEKSRERALEVVEEAKFKVKQSMNEKRKKSRHEKKDSRIDEDEKEKFEQAVRVMTTKLFADYERKRRMVEERNQEEKKRKREEEIEAKKTQETEKEWQKNFEESRQSRVSSWQTFNKNKKRKDIRPPKPKVETKRN